MSGMEAQCARKGCGHALRSHRSPLQSGFGYGHCESCHRRYPFDQATADSGTQMCRHPFVSPKEEP